MPQRHAPAHNPRRNPSAWPLRIAIAIISSIAAAVSVYMGMFQWKLIDIVWDPVFGQQTAQVLTSDVSHALSRWFRLPDAILGAIVYFGDVVLALAGSTRRWQYRPWLVMAFGILVIPAGIVSATLISLQGTVVGAWCFLCMVTAIISLTLVALAANEVWFSLKYLRQVHRESTQWPILWNAFWGKPSREGARAGRILEESL